MRAVLFLCIALLGVSAAFAADSKGPSTWLRDYMSPAKASAMSGYYEEEVGVWGGMRLQFVADDVPSLALWQCCRGQQFDSTAWDNARQGPSTSTTPQTTTATPAAGASVARLPSRTSAAHIAWVNTFHGHDVQHVPVFHVMPVAADGEGHHVLPHSIVLREGRPGDVSGWCWPPTKQSSPCTRQPGLCQPASKALAKTYALGPHQPPR